MPNNPVNPPLPADLPVNWNIGDTVSPTGVDVGLTQKHGYNYLMQQVNAAQQAANDLGTGFAGLTPASLGAVPITRYINGKDLASDITLTPGDVGAVPTSRTINGKALSSNINLTPADIGVTAKRTCRFVVGTSTNGWTQDDCDYLCDGVDDQVEIQAAIDALPSSGGEIVILRGEYHMSDNLTLKADVSIKGELNYSANSMINYASRVTLWKQGSSNKVIKGADRVVIENIFTIMYKMLLSNTYNVQIRNCNMWVTGTASKLSVENSCGVIDLSGLSYSRIINYNGDITLRNANTVQISGGQNFITNTGNILLISAQKCTVSNLTCEDANSINPVITLSGASHDNIIMGNNLIKNTSNDVMVQCGVICIDGNSYNNLICGNMLQNWENVNSKSLLCDVTTHDNIVMGNSFIKYNYSNAGTNNQFINNFVYEGGD